MSTRTHEQYEAYEVDLRARMIACMFDLEAVIRANRDRVRVNKLNLDTFLDGGGMVARMDVFSTFARACYIGELWMMILDNQLISTDELTRIMIRHELPAVRKMELAQMRGEEIGRGYSSGLDEAEKTKN